MSPDERKFAEIVRNAEAFARQSPRAYRVAVFALASAGFLYICTVVIGAFAVLGAMLYGIFLGLTSSQHSPAVAVNMVRLMAPLLIGVITFLATVVRSLYVVIPAPNGPRLSRETAGRLYAFLDGISAALKAPRFDHVLLDMDLNAGVVQVPRFGLMGPQRNYLIIGFPLMKALSRDQFKAVMAHELGHISRNHSRFSGWIYRQRATWIRIFHTVEHNWIFGAFLSWYAPYFMAYTFVLARSNEYVADKCAAELVGAQTTAETLIAVEVQHQYLAEKFWPSVLRYADSSPQPVILPFSAMFADDAQRPTANESTKWMLAAWKGRADLDDTHPSLSDRLAALGFRGIAGGPLDLPKPPLPPPAPIERSAADELLGGYAPRLATTLDVEWGQRMAPKWVERYRSAQQDRLTLDRLSELARTHHLNLDDAVLYVGLCARFDGVQAAIPYARALAENYPKAARAQVMAGRILSEAGDPSAVAAFEAAARLEPQLKAPMQLAIADFLQDQGRWTEAHQYEMRAASGAPAR